MVSRAVIFDLGGVLIDWNPRYLYRKLLPNEAEVEEFLGSVCTQAWNEKQDAGRPFADATAELCARHPDQAALIRAYRERWPEMLGGLVEGTHEVVDELSARGVPLYALTNWSDETFPHALERFPILGRFRDIVVSGREGMAKPDPRLYRILLERNRLDPAACLYVDDVARNVEAARALGMHGVLFRSASQLRSDLAAAGVAGEST